MKGQNHDFSRHDGASELGLTKARIGLLKKDSPVQCYQFSIIVLPNSALRSPDRCSRRAEFLLRASFGERLRGTPHI